MGSAIGESDFSVDSTKEPKEIDMTSGNGVSRGIYEFQNDQLRICYGKPGANRPKEFATKPNSDLKLLVLKRDKS